MPGEDLAELRRALLVLDPETDREKLTKAEAALDVAELPDRKEGRTSLHWWRREAMRLRDEGGQERQLRRAEHYLYQEIERVRRMPQPRHECHAEGCTAEVPPRMLMCLRHWRMVPKELQRQVWATYREGQEIRKDPTKEYMAAQRAAVRAVAEKEGRR